MSKAGCTLSERTPNTNVRYYHLSDVRQNKCRTFDSHSDPFPHEAVHQRKFLRDIDAYNQVNENRLKWIDILYRF